MTRDPAQLTGRTFDLLVIGGGVYGLTIAYDAAQRGLSVALIERDDFGGGSSFNHLRTIHGGLRYLQSLDVRRARESILERRTLAVIAPHAVRPMPFVLPLYPSVLKGRTAMRLGLLLDRTLARDRNNHVPHGLALPPGRVLSRAEAIERFPALPRKAMTGAVLWWDYITPESDRLTFSWALAAVQSGATLSNYVRADELLVDRRRVVGARATDRTTGHTIEVSARITVNATAFAADRLLAPLNTSTGLVFLKALNLVTRRMAGDEAMGGRSASGRYLFLVPWRARALFGTWEIGQSMKDQSVGVTEAEVANFIDELNRAFPALSLRRDDVTLVHRGLVPATSSGNEVALEPHEQVRDHAANGLDGVISVVGAKYTTARAVAERVTDRLLDKLGRSEVPSRTATTTLPGGDLDEVPADDAEAARLRDQPLQPDVLAHLVASYGSRYRDVLASTASHPELRQRIADDSPVIAAQLVWAVRHEMAVTLTDAVTRRTPLGALGYPGDEPASRAAAIVGAELGWNDERQRREIETLRSFYVIE
jgi:glycerol-3-phosphate dehydrogenase